MRRTMRIVCILLTTHVDVLSALTPTRLGTIPLTTGRSFARLLRYDGFAAKTSPEIRKGILSVCRRQRYGTEQNGTERNRTERNRTERNRTEQNGTDSYLSFR